MWWTNVFAVGVMVGFIFVAVYTIVDRICRCREACALAKAYGEFVMKNGKSDEMMASVNSVRKIFEKVIAESKEGVAK